jgi:hypothetical protein
MKAPKNGGRAVKDCRRGGHRSARSEAKEDREEAAKAAWPRSLTAWGEFPPYSINEGQRRSRHSSDQRERMRHAGGSGAKAVPRRGPSEKRAREHAVAD